jgi:hypothetical protein
MERYYPSIKAAIGDLPTSFEFGTTGDAAAILKDNIIATYVLCSKARSAGAKVSYQVAANAARTSRYIRIEKGSKVLDVRVANHSDAGHAPYGGGKLVSIWSKAKITDFSSVTAAIAAL